MKYLILALAVIAGSTQAQDVEYTYCQNGKGEVVIVSNFTCPRGYWCI